MSTSSRDQSSHWQQQWPDINAGYAAMAEDVEREAEAKLWMSELSKDGDDE